MIDHREQAALSIITFSHNYSDVEVINALRYLGRTKNKEALSSIINPKKVNMTLRRLFPKKWSLGVLEAIKQFEFIEYL